MNELDRECLFSKLKKSLTLNNKHATLIHLTHDIWVIISSYLSSMDIIHWPLVLDRCSYYSHRKYSGMQ